MKFLNALNQFFGKNQSASKSEVDSSPKNVPQSFIGRNARTITALKTHGYIEIDDQRLEVESTTGFIPKGAQVKITGKRMGWLLVEAVNPLFTKKRAS